MYKTGLEFPRTTAQKYDIFASWARDDQAFFAAGAYHILANLFVQIHHDEGYEMIFIKPAPGFSGMHMFASDGTWAFDHNGWTREAELLRATETAFSHVHPNWNYETVTIQNSSEAFETFCRNNNHRLPWQYAHLPWERAHRYITQFPTTPPDQKEEIVL